MNKNNKRISRLEESLRFLEEKHQKFGDAINLIAIELDELRLLQNSDESKPAPIESVQESKLPLDTVLQNQETEAVNESIEELPQEQKTSDLRNSIESEADFYAKFDADFDKKRKTAKSSIDWEKLIGENIINKVGIIITVLGVGIGANYVIENDLISPLARIFIGFIFSFAMVGVAYKLRTKYLNYSAVLFGGAIASMYVLTYTSYDFYGLIPQMATFLLLSVLTIIAVVTAIGYNKQWISIFGLVGGYAVPFLLGEDSGRTSVLFSYVLFLNLGVLFVSLYKNWRLLFISAFTFTWLIFIAWFNSVDPVHRDVNLSFVFSTAFFLLFYSAFLISKVRDKNELISIDISTLLLNTFIYFGIGYATLEGEIEVYRGAFTIIIAFMHLIIGQIIQRYELPTKTTQSLIYGLSLVFITLAIPIQFTEKWITMAWSLEALLLLWMGRSRKLIVYEILSYPAIFLASLSLLYYWVWFYSEKSSASTIPFINQLFLTSFVFLVAFSAILYILRTDRESSSLRENHVILSTVNIVVPFILISGIYLVLFFEVSRIFDFWRFKSLVVESSNDGFFTPYNPSINSFKILALVSYSIAFLNIGFRINKKWFDIESLYRTGFYLSIFTISAFFLAFFGSVQELRHYYIGILDSAPHTQSIANILVRYIFIAFGVLNIKTLIILLPYQDSKTFNESRFELFLYFTLLFVLSSELIQWLDIFGFENSYKLGLSILWGLFSMGLVLFGILKSKQQLRIASLVLFATTLVKLFFYDISHLSTISKTVVFVSLGILLLVISYLYNRYKDKIVEFD